MVEDKAMSACEFRGDDAGFKTWLAAHPDGYVINIARSYNPADARVHHARCRTINGQNPRAGAWTGPYVKVCAEHLIELEQWASEHAEEPIPACGICHSAHTVRPTAPQPSTRAGAPLSGGRSYIHGPTPDRAIVEAWVDDYVQLGDQRACQKELRAEILARSGQLDPSTGQVLHATFFGSKPVSTDVENLLLFNVGSFAVAGRNGIRFEYGAGVPQAPDGAQYRYCYRYALAPRSGAFAAWQQGRTLVSFDWTDLDAFNGDKKLAQVWLALARERARAEVADPARAPETPFVVTVQLRPPRGRQPVWGNLVKGVVDGVVCAFHAHTDVAVLPEVVRRLAATLPADPVEIEKHLLDQGRAVLGVVSRLVYPYGAGVKWDPADNLCVAGELLPVNPVDRRWAIRGEIVELFR